MIRGRYCNALSSASGHVGLFTSCSIQLHLCGICVQKVCEVHAINQFYSRGKYLVLALALCRFDRLLELVRPIIEPRRTTTVSLSAGEKLAFTLRWVTICMHISSPSCVLYMWENCHCLLATRSKQFNAELDFVCFCTMYLQLSRTCSFLITTSVAWQLQFFKFLGL